MSRGGSRHGAGRPGYRPKAEHLRRVDIRTWRKSGHLARAGAFRWYWLLDGERTGEIAVYVHDANSLTLGYALNVNGQQRDASQLVGVISVYAHNAPVDCPGKPSY